MGNHGQGRTRCGPDFRARRRFQSYLIKILRAVSILRNPLRPPARVLIGLQTSCEQQPTSTFFHAGTFDMWH